MFKVLFFLFSKFLALTYDLEFVKETLFYIVHGYGFFFFFLPFLGNFNYPFEKNHVIINVINFHKKADYNI